MHPPMLAALVVVVLAAPAAAQDPVGRIEVLVTDSTRGALGAAEVADTIAGIRGETSTTGLARLRLPAGTRILRTRRLGYAPRTDTVTVIADSVVTYDVVLVARPQELEPIVVTTQRRPGLFGVVHGIGLVGVGGAEVELLGAGARTMTGADGRFRFPAVAAGTYFLRVRRIGYRSRTMSVAVARGGTELSIPLVALPSDLTDLRAASGYDARQDVLMQDFATRWSNASLAGRALVPRSQLVQSGARTLHDALLESPATARAGFQRDFAGGVALPVCVVNGVVTSGVDTRSFLADEVEAVEIYRTYRRTRAAGRGADGGPGVSGVRRRADGECVAAAAWVSARR